jgi:60 kDa SS-A/Ro ribonucleoprotein
VRVDGNRLSADGVVVLTDNETWAGRQHPVQALAGYRRSVNAQVRVVVVSMAATGTMIGELGEPDVLNVAG